MEKIVFLILFSIIVISCTRKLDASKTTGVTEKQETMKSNLKLYKVNSGTIYWSGSTIAYDHRGTIKVIAGNLTLEEGTIKSGDFIIDMTSINNTDLDAESKPKLESHLKSKDFFDTEKFPNASFVITSVKEIDTEEANYSIGGKLTLMGVTQEVTFPALIVKKSDGALSAISDKFIIDRTKWEIRYASSTVGTIGDKVISDDIKLQIEIEAKERNN